MNGIFVLAIAVLFLSVGWFLNYLKKYDSRWIVDIRLNRLGDWEELRGFRFWLTAFFWSVVVWPNRETRIREGRSA